jgi:hypothetical protein
MLLALGAAVIGGSGWLPADDFTSPTLGSYLSAPRDLRIENIRILAETPLPSGQTLLQVASDVRNLEDGSWIGITVGPALDAIQFGLVDALETTIHFGDAAAGGLVQGTTAVHVVVDAAQLAAARAEILAGTILATTGRTLTGAVVDGTQLTVEGVQIVQEITLANGKVLLLFTANVRNSLQEVVTDLAVNVVTTLGTLPYELASTGLQFVNLAAGAYADASGPGAFYVAVDNADLNDVRTDLLSGDLLTVAGTELYVFSAPPRGIDELTESNWQSPAQTSLTGEITLVFSTTNAFIESLQPGDLLVEDPGVNRLIAPAYDNPFNPFDDNPPKVLAEYLPLEVISVNTGLGGQMLVTGRQRQLLEVVKSATFYQESKTSPYDSPVRDPYDPVLENTYTHEEAAAREAVARVIEQSNPRDGRLADLRGMTSKPMVFNKEDIVDGVNVTGEILLRSSGLQLEVKIRNFVLQRAIAHLDAGVIANLVIEVEKPVDTSGKPAEEKKKHLEDLPLPGVTFNIGGVPVEVAPLFYVDAGIEANVPQKLTLPLQSSFIIGMEMGFDRSRITAENDGFFYEPVSEFIPLRVSDPTVFDEAAASVGVWVELGMSIVGSIVPLPDTPEPGEPTPASFGPTLAARASSNFTLSPLADPWWSLDFDVDLIGRFSAEILGQTIVDAEASLHTFELANFDRDAGGPLISLPGMSIEFPSNASIPPLSAENVRWGRLFQPRDGFGGLSHGFVIAPDTDGFITVGGESRIGYSTVARFSPEGNVIWARDMGTQRLVRYGAALANGSVVTVGQKGTDLVLSEFDVAGNRTRVNSLTPAFQSFDLTDLAVARDGNGQPTGIFVCGFINQGTVRESDPFLARFDTAGNLIWSQYYALPEDDEVHGMIVAADGNLILCGFTDANVAAPALGTPHSENVFKDATTNGLLMKVAAADGAVVWAQAYPSRRGMIFEDVVEAPDGTLFAGGSAGRIVTQDRPVNLFAKFKADGTLIDHVLVGDDPDQPDLLANGGNSPYDTTSRMVWAEGGLIACGNTGLGTGQAGWVMGLTEELGVKFFSIVDGAQAETFLDIAAASDGIAVLADTYSMYPWGSQGTRMPLLMKLPWEGIMRFHPDIATRTLLLPPQVFHSSASTEFQMLSQINNPGSPPQTFSNKQSPVAFNPTPLPWSAGGSPGTPADPPALTLLAVENVDAAQIETYADWAAYHNLFGSYADKEDDDDGDGLLNIFEAFFGRNPHVAETEPVMTLSTGELNGQQVVVLEFNRSTYSQSFGIRFENSADLTNWLAATGLTEYAQPIDNSTERVQLVALRDLPAKFYRVAADLEAAGSPPGP